MRKRVALTMMLLSVLYGLIEYVHTRDPAYLLLSVVLATLVVFVHIKVNRFEAHN